MRILKFIPLAILLVLAVAFAPSFLIDSGISEPTPIDKFLNYNLPSSTPNPSINNTSAPLLLSQTGAFSNLENLTSSPGVIPYDMIEPFWSDGAAKFRWMAIPNDGTHNTDDEKIVFSNEEPWIFPKGAVLIKHFELGGQRLETRFEVKGDDNQYYYLTYRWNDEETDADLIFDGADEDIMVNGELQTWHFPSVSECQSCHTSEAGRVLGPKTRHLNKSIIYPESGIEANQLVTLSFLGIIDENINDGNADSYMAVAAKDDPNASLEYRARSYLDVNCSNCHHPESINGGMFDTRITTPLEDQNIIYGPLIYDEGLVDPKVVIPEDVAHSMIHFRMNSLQNGVAMPPLAKNVIDQEGVLLIKDWINSIEPSDNTAPQSLISATPVFGQVPLEVTFDGSSSNDDDEDDDLNFLWDFGDGNTSTNINPTHTYFNLGTYTVSLTVDDGEFSDINYVTIEVNNTPPNPTNVGFTDFTDLLNGNNYSGVAIAVSDMNGDGKDDIIRYDQADNLEIHYQNASNANFTEYYYGSVSNANQWSTCIADFDQNGLNDILVGGAYDNIKLIKNNNGNNSYTSNILGNSNIFLQGSNFVDINGDGWVDIFACHDDSESRAYSNNQDGTFSFDPNLIDTETNPISDNSGNYASIWTDYDNDNDLDLYISKCRIGVSDSNDPRRINMLFQNDGNNNFTEVADDTNLKIGAQTWLTDFGDIDNDGDLDAIVINHYDDCNLMRNNNDGTFTEVTSNSGLFPTLQGSNSFGIQGLFRDFNNDGYLDLIVTGTEHYLFYNNGDGTFTEASNPFNSNEIESLAVGDLNHDGFLDVYAGYANIYTTPSNISDRLFLNDGNDNHFISVLLEGTESNINGIGARIEIYGDWGKQIREVRSGEGYGIHNSFRQHFGIGEAEEIEKIVINWPSGNEQTINYPDIDQLIKVVEGECFEVNQACDDGDECTEGETFDSNCNCTGGVFQDEDNDSICDANDQCNNALIGTPCNDGDGCTINDVYLEDCQCLGVSEFVNMPLVVLGIDETCAFNDAIISLSFPDTPNRTNIEFSIDGGMTYPFNTSDDVGTYLISNLQPGTYDLWVRWGNDDCPVFYEMVTLEEIPDADNDGVCDEEDQCNGTDDSLIGTPCDDGDNCTIGEIYDTNCNCVGGENNWVQADANEILTLSIVLNPSVVGSTGDIVNIIYVIYNAGLEPMTNIQLEPQESLLSGGAYTTTIDPSWSGDPNNNGQLDPEEVWFYTDVKSYEYNQGDVFVIAGGVSGNASCGVEIGASAKLLFTYGENIDISTNKEIVHPGEEIEVQLTARLLIDEQAALQPGKFPVDVNGKSIDVPLSCTRWEGRNIKLSSSDINHGEFFNPFDTSNPALELVNFCDQGGLDSGRNLDYILDESESIETVRKPCSYAGEDEIACEFPDWVFCYTLKIPEDYKETEYIISARDEFEIWKAEEPIPGSGIFDPFVNLTETINLNGVDELVLKVDQLNNIEESNDNALTVYPNPADKHISISAPMHEFAKGFNVKMLDIKGKLIKSEYIGYDDLMNIESVSNGIYILKIYDHQNVHLTNKMISIVNE